MNSGAEGPRNQVADAAPADNGPGGVVASTAVEANRSPVKWYNGLGTRVAFLFTLLLTLGGLTLSFASVRIPALLGLTTTEDLQLLGPPGFKPEEAFANSTFDQNGAWIPSDQDVEEFSQDLSRSGEALVVLDLNNRVLGQSKDLPVLTGTTWAHDDSTLWATVEVELGVHLRTVRSPLEISGDQVGWLVELVVDEEIHAKTYHRENKYGEPFDEEACYFNPREQELLVDHERFDVAVARENVVQKAFILVFVVSSIALISLSVSRLMTRRLRQMSALVNALPSEPGSMPGPFDESGRMDEITVLAHSMNTMRGRVGELVSTLEGRDRERREWIAQVSHDLRTPLTALIVCLDRVKRTQDESPNSDPAITSLLDTATLDANRVMALADDLLEIARLDAGTETIREPIPPTELVRRTLTALEPLCADRGTELVGDLEPNLPLIWGDGRLLNRALENLIANACHHSNGQVEVRTRKAKGGVLLSVLDNGPGFANTAPGEDVALDELERSRNRADSSGLGLVVARRVAEAMGGRLSALNRPEGGACVMLSIPTNANPDDSQ